MKTLNILVNLQINTCGYEKNSYILLTDVPEDCEGYAFEMAATLEAHNELTMDGSMIDDGGCEFLYALNNQQVVSDEDMKVLTKYMHSFGWNKEAIESIKGFEWE